jgi:hypothetical protein
MLFGVSANLALLIVFKYADFFLRIFSDVADIQIEPIGLVLPLGISFFTFTQIAYLVDLSRGFSGRYDFWLFFNAVFFWKRLMKKTEQKESRTTPPSAPSMERGDRQRRCWRIGFCCPDAKGTRA